MSEREERLNKQLKNFLRSYGHSYYKAVCNYLEDREDENHKEQYGKELDRLDEVYSQAIADLLLKWLREEVEKNKLNKE